MDLNAMRINVRRGLLRLWLVLATLWAITVGVYSSGDVRFEFKKARIRNIDALGHKPEVPVDCSQVRGTAGDYLGEYNDAWVLVRDDDISQAVSGI
jgi:hypothetical protein